jgi:SAM-dependent methyltransferase
MSDQLEVLQITCGTKPGTCCGAEEGAPPAARDNPQTIRTEVQNYYGEVAELQLTGRSQPDCCGSDLYEGEDLNLLPDTAVQSSRGCGNPHAIASLQPGEIVLDLGSGGGLDVLLAARQVGEDGYVYGVDMTDRMLELARGNAAKIGAANVEFRKGDLEDLPLHADAVDVIISNCVVNLTPDKGIVLREAFRVLKPGGRLAISDIVVDGDLDGLPVSEDQIRAGLSWAGCIAGALTVTDLTSILQEAGFEEIAIKVEQRYCAADFNGDLPSALTDLQPQVLQELLQRFTSSSIEARKPQR